jgi:cytochrome c-type biogenesis protein CcmH/NrfG
MNEHDSSWDSFDDSLATILDTGGDQPAADDALRRALLAQTTGVLRFRRRAKRCVLVASLVACYLAGATTMGLLRAGSPPPSTGQPTIANSDPTPPRPSHPSPQPRKNQLAAKAVKKPTAFESWRRIGDHYLNQSGDVSLAVAGYSEAIRLASDEERRISPERDNWLMMALKDARSKEKTHAYP